MQCLSYGQFYLKLDRSKFAHGFEFELIIRYQFSDISDIQNTILCRYLLSFCDFLALVTLLLRMYSIDHYRIV